MNDEIQKLLEKSEEAIQVAEKLLKESYFSHAASKAYYSMFYAAQALLKSEGINVIKHSAVEAMFGYHFSKTGRIDPKFHKMFIEARDVRELADYAISDDIIGKVATQKVEDGKEFIKAIKSLLNKKEQKHENAN